jgi:dTDP-4-dehydrorhamnose reductase
VRIYVTGAKGLVGRELIRLLEARQHEVLGHEEVEIRDADVIARDLVPARPDWVIHLAGYTAVDDAEAHPDEAAQVNVTGTVNVASAARAAGSRLLYMSTDFVYDGEGTEPYVETDRPAPLSVYGHSKLAGEYAALTVLENDCLIVRGGWLYGRGRGFIKTIVAAAASRPSLRVVTDEVGCPTLVPDLVVGLTALVEAGASGIVHLANRGGTSRYELARTALRLAGDDPEKIQPTTQAEYGRPARRPRFSVLSCANFERLTGDSLRPREEALADHVAASGNSGVAR